MPLAFYTVWETLKKTLYALKTLTTFPRKIFCTAIYQSKNTTLLYTTTMYYTVLCFLKKPE